MTVVAVVFWVAVGTLAYTQLGYPLLLALVVQLTRAGAHAGTEVRVPAAVVADGPGAGADPRPGPHPQHGLPEPLPSVSVIVAAYNEQAVIGARVANLRAQDYPPELLEVIVASDGSTDSTAAQARAAGADRVLELPRGGKIRAQDAAVACARGTLLAFSDANSVWQADALARLVDALADPRVGYVCGAVTFSDAGATNQEGLYWRYEMWVRRLESGLRSVTSGNGAIYATRRESYLEVDPLAGHDLSFPFNMVKRGWRAVYAPGARASEKMAPSIGGEFARKRRMARRTWPTVWGGGLLSPRGYDPLYGLMIFSHRLLRYLAPFLHGVALGLSLALIGHGAVYAACAAAQLALLALAALAGVLRVRPALIARYYVATNFALALGLWDWLRGERSPVWETVEGTR